MKSADVVVVGGGVVGCAIAYFLAREGVAVTLLERADVAIHASGVAAGMLAPLTESHEEGPLLRLGVESLEAFEEFSEELRERSGLDIEYVRSGILRVAQSEEQEAWLRRQARALGRFDVSWVDADAARSREPHLAPDVRGAFWSPREGHVRSALLARACALSATALGADVRRGIPAVGLVRRDGRVTGVRTPDGDWSARHVVIATGAWAGETGSWLGLDRVLPVTPVRGQILALEAPRALLHTIVWGANAYLVPRRDGSVVVGATVERVGFECRVTAEGIRGLLEAAPGLIPTLASSTFRGAWAGLRPDTPDHLPAVGPVPGYEGLILAVGHYRNGVLLAPVTGRLVAEMVLGKGVPEEARALRPERLLA